MTALIRHAFGFVDTQQINQFGIEVFWLRVADDMFVNTGFQGNEKTALNQGGLLRIVETL